MSSSSSSSSLNILLLHPVILHFIFRTKTHGTTTASPSCGEIRATALPKWSTRHLRTLKASHLRTLQTSHPRTEKERSSAHIDAGNQPFSGVGWGGMITFMFLCTHRHSNLIIFLAVEKRQAQLFHDQLPVGWGELIRFMFLCLHTHSNLIIFLAVEHLHALLFHDQLPLGWVGVGWGGVG